MKKLNVLLIDNYDSFTYNLVHQIEGVLGYAIEVKKNDEVALSEIEAYDCLVLSPGPGLPDEAGLLKEIIQTYGATKRIFGVCLGLQAIGEVFGAKLKNLTTVYHGLETKIYKTETDCRLFDGLEAEFNAGRYHSWTIDETTLPKKLLVTGRDEQQEIMSIRHIDYPIYGVQYHPESIMTEHGDLILSNFFSINPS